MYEYEDYEVTSLDTKALLPQEFADTLKLSINRTASDDTRRAAYGVIYHLRQSGWTLDAIGKSLGLSRERIRQICIKYENEGAAWGVTVDAENIPKVPMKVKIQRRRKLISPMTIEEVEELNRLRADAALVRGNLSPTHPRRVAAEQYVRRLTELRKRGYTNYYIAKMLGLTTGAVGNRLVRYGVVSSTGKSRAMTPVKMENRPADDGLRVSSADLPTVS